MNTLDSAVPYFVGHKKPVRLSHGNERRLVFNLWAGPFDLFWGNQNVRPSINGGNRVKAGGNVEIKSNADIWVIRNTGEEGLCEFSEEFSNG